jgi:hypothetical protein
MNFWFTYKLVDRIFNERLPRARKERKIAPHASAGYPPSQDPLLPSAKRSRGGKRKLRGNSRTFGSLFPYLPNDIFFADAIFYFDPDQLTDFRLLYGLVINLHGLNLILKIGGMPLDLNPVSNLKGPLC